jgi:hypothetical protein
MAVTLSSGAKKTLDIVLSIVGLIISTLVASAAQFPSPYNTILGAAGIPIGYLISDLVAVVDTGSLPSTATVEQQAATTWISVKPLVQAQVAKISNPSEQAVVNALLSVIDAEVAKVTPSSPSATTPKPA